MSTVIGGYTWRLGIGLKKEHEPDRGVGVVDIVDHSPS